MHDDSPHQAEFQALDCCHHNCCRPLTVTHWAQPRPALRALVADQPAKLLLHLGFLRRTVRLNPSLSVRAPPTSSIA
jgi:hypothetical protein